MALGAMDYERASSPGLWKDLRSDRTTEGPHAPVHSKLIPLQAMDFFGLTSYRFSLLVFSGFSVLLAS